MRGKRRLQQIQLPKETRLSPWTEVCGTYQGHTEDEDGVLVEVRATYYVRVPLLDNEQREKLQRKKVGEEIGIARTDMAEPAYVVR